MSIKLGQSNISNVYLGNTNISKIYKGTDLVYQKQVLPPEPQTIITTVETVGSSTVITDDGWLDADNTKSCSFSSREFNNDFGENDCKYIRMQYQCQIGSRGSYNFTNKAYSNNYDPGFTIYGIEYNSPTSSSSVLIGSITGISNTHLSFTNQDFSMGLFPDIIEWSGENIKQYTLSLTLEADFNQSLLTVTVTRLDTNQSISKNCTLPFGYTVNNLLYCSFSRSSASNCTRARVKIDTIQVDYGTTSNNIILSWQPEFPIVYE